MTLPSRTLKRARFWSLMGELVSLMTYLAGISFRRMDLARCPTTFKRLWKDSFFYNMGITQQFLNFCVKSKDCRRFIKTMGK